MRNNPVSINKYSALVRVSGRDKTARELIQEAQQWEPTAPLKWIGPVSIDNSNDVHPRHSDDYAQVDPELAIAEPTLSNPVTMPMPRIGYGGLTPQQRHRMITWLDDPLAPAPDTIRQIYIAHLETALFESDGRNADAMNELSRLLASDSWHLDISASRALILGYWLQQDGDGLTEWFSKNQLPDQLVGIVAGHIAMLGKQLTVGLFRSLLRHWLPKQPHQQLTIPSNDILELRLSALEATLGQEPLTYALAQYSDEPIEPSAWRCTHRDLRLAIPQPDIEQVLKPLLLEALEGVNDAPPSQMVSLEQPSQTEEISQSTQDNEEGEATDEDDGTQERQAKIAKWSLVLEFGHSRSEYFDFAIFRARQRAGYSQIMDEDRTLIHRVVFTKSEMRHFWPLWEYVQNWSSVHVYVNGTEVEKWKVWPYSQYLR